MLYQSGGPGISISGSTGNTYTGSTTVSTSVTLDKSSGDALCGTITVNSSTLTWLNNAQISDASNMTLATGASLDLAGFSDTLGNLTMAAGSTVATGTAGVLTVNSLIVGGTPQAPATYTSSSAFVTGSGSVVVLNSPPPTPPDNDNFADAIDLPGDTGTQTGTTTVNATFEVGEPVCVYTSATNTVWFKWTCTTDGAFTISTLGSTNPSAGEWDAVLGIYTGATVATLTPLPGTPQDSGLEETMSVLVSAGTTYYIQLAGDNGDPPQDAANILLNWSWAATGLVVDIDNNTNPVSPEDPNGPGININKEVGLGNSGRLIGQTQTHWSSGGFSVPLDLNGNTLIIDTGGNGATASGAISGNGVVLYQSGGPGISVSGSTGNTYTGMTTVSTSVTLGKSSGDALCGTITVTSSTLTWLNNDQISNASNVTLASSSILNLAGFADTIGNLTMATGTTVATGTSGVLTVNSLTVGGAPMAAGTYTATDGFVTGGGNVVVLSAPLPVLIAHAGADQALSPGTPSAVLGATPAATDGTPPYTYSWSPSTGLDDANLEHPTVTTTAATTTYTLTVTDSLLATATDAVIVTYEAPPGVTDISGTLTQNLDTVIGAGNSGRLIGNAQSHWDGTTSVSNLDLNGFQFTINNGGGNGQTYNGAITGPGSLLLQGSAGANWDPDIRLGGTLANSPDGVTINSGCIRLNKTAGVDALAGAITVIPSVGNTVIIQLLQSDQINDASTITSTAGAGAFHLEMPAFNETISGLDIKIGDTVDTGIDGVLKVTTLTVGGVSMPKGAYTASSGFVTGSGYIDVDNFGPPVIGNLPGIPANPTPTDTDSNVNPAYLAKLTWAAALEATSYDVYLWLAAETKPVTPTATDVSLPEYPVSPQVLSLENYKWQVVAKNILGDTAGPEWTFSTVDRRDISGTLTKSLDAIVGAGPARLIGNAQTFYGGTTSASDINLNGFQFTINSGGGNAQTYNGAISGPGTLRIQGRGDASWSPDPQLGGTLANNPDSVTIESGHVVLNKTVGVDALAGAINIIPSVGNTVIIQLLKSDQINDASTITSTADAGAFHLEMGGFSDTLSGLVIKTGDTVDTGTGGVLTVTDLTVNGGVKGPGTYTSAEGFVTGSGSVVVSGGTGSPFDTWAATYAGGGTPGEDYNNDGVSNGVAYFMGMNGLATNPSVATAGSVRTVTWSHVGVVASFEVQVSDNLSDWSPADPGDVVATAPPTGQVVYTFPGTSAKQFCRLVVTP